MTPTEPIRSPGLIEALRRYRRLSVTIIAVFTIVGVGFALLQPRSSSAVARITPPDPRNGGVTGTAGQSTVQEFAQFIAAETRFVASDAVLQPVADARGITLDELRAAVTITPSADTDYIVVRATDSDPDEAAALANEIIESYRTVKVAERTDEADRALEELRAQADAIDERIDRLGESLATSPGNQAAITKLAVERDLLGRTQQRISDIEVERNVTADNIGVIDQATPPGSSPLRPVLVWGIAGAVLGLLVAMIITWLKASNHPRVETSEDVSPLLDAPLLASVPRLSAADVKTARTYGSMPTSPYQIVASAIQTRAPGGIILLAGVTPKAGCSTTAANLAVALARSGHAVAAIDADPLDGALARILGVANDGAGLSERLEQSLLDGALARRDLDDRHGVDVMPAGPSTATFENALRSDDAVKMLDSLRAKYDYVIIDCPPCIDSSVFASLASHADRVVAVVKNGARIADVEAASHVLDLVADDRVGYVYTFAG